MRIRKNEDSEFARPREIPTLVDEVHEFIAGVDWQTIDRRSFVNSIATTFAFLNTGGSALFQGELFPSPQGHQLLVAANAGSFRPFRRTWACRSEGEVCERCHVVKGGVGYPDVNALRSGGERK